MFEKEILKEEAQNTINKIYGEGEWKLLEYEGGHEPCSLEHKCGIKKTVSRFSTFKLGKTKCKCQYEKGRPKLKFDELAKKISDATYGTYELVEITNNSKFKVNHKSCERPPFETSSVRFFTKGERCASCSKKGRVGRKLKAERIAEINKAIKEMQMDAN